MTTPNPLTRSKNQRLENKVCLVTGGTRGIGLAIAEMLVEENALVVLCSRQQASLDQALFHFETYCPGKVKGKVADVMHYGEVHALFEFVDQEFGGLDVLVNNAGVGEFAKVSELSPEQWGKTLGTNLTGAFYCSQAALSRFERRGGGYIVNISSLAGKNAFAGGAAYNASKFGLNGFSEALMLDARYDNVRVTTVMPGSVATEFANSRTHSVVPEARDAEKKQEGTEGITGSDWKVWPEDVADIVRMVLCMPARTMVSQVEVRPARPKRK